MVERQLGTLEPGMVRIRFGAGGICGSDMHYFRHARTGDFVVTSPLVLGHEVAGEIVELGSGVTGLSVGTTSRSTRPAGAANAPAAGRPREPVREHLLHGLGVQDAAHAGRLRQPVRRLQPSASRCPKELSWSAAALAGPLAVCLHAVARAGAMEDRKAIVFGAGPIGLLTMLAARLAGAVEVAVVDVAQARSPSRNA